MEREREACPYPYPDPKSNHILVGHYSSVPSTYAQCMSNLNTTAILASLLCFLLEELPWAVFILACKRQEILPRTSEGLEAGLNHRASIPEVLNAQRGHRKPEKKQLWGLNLFLDFSFQPKNIIPCTPAFSKDKENDKSENPLALFQFMRKLGKTYGTIRQVQGRLSEWPDLGWTDEPTPRDMPSDGHEFDSRSLYKGLNTWTSSARDSNSKKTDPSGFAQSRKRVMQTEFSGRFQM